MSIYPQLLTICHNMWMIAQLVYKSLLASSDPRFIAFATLFHLTSAAAIPLENPRSSHASLIYHRSNQDCGFEGNADLYGLGIRLGVYLQWISALCAGQLLPSEVRTSLANTYRWFLLAIFIALVVMIADFPSIHAPEALIMFYIYFGGHFVVLSSADVRLKLRRVRRSASMFKNFTINYLGVATSSYSIWFWQKGLQMTDTRTECVSYGFLFTKVLLHQPAVYRSYTAFTILFLVTILLNIWNLFRIIMLEIPPLYSLNPLSIAGRRDIGTVVKKQITIWLSPLPPSKVQAREAVKKPAHPCSSHVYRKDTPVRTKKAEKAFRRQQLRRKKRMEKAKIRKTKRYQKKKAKRYGYNQRLRQRANVLIKNTAVDYNHQDLQLSIFYPGC